MRIKFVFACLALIVPAQGSLVRVVRKAPISTTEALTELPAEDGLAPVAAGAKRDSSLEEADPPKPVLQLREKVKVYLLFEFEGENKGHMGYDRDAIMIREGIQMHPFIELVGEGPASTQEQKDAANRADIILYPMMGDVKRDVCSKNSCPVPTEKLAVLDFSDGYHKISYAPPANILFKRSLVKKVDGSFDSVTDKCGYDDPQPCFPLDYAIRPDDYKGLTSNSLSLDRKFPVVYLVQSFEGLPEHTIAKVAAARLRVKKWLSEMDLPHTAFVGATKTSEEKFRHADIVIVVDPSAYEGQHAIYEAVGNGAVVMANQRWVPMPFPLEGGKHVHYFDTCSTDDAKLAFQEKVRELLSQTPEAKKCIQTAGMEAWLAISPSCQQSGLHGENDAGISGQAACDSAAT
jgi:hypothetical protein